MHSPSAAVLMVFLTLVISAAGSRCWLIVATLLHQYLSSGRPGTGFRHGQLVILRNSSTSTGTIGDLLWLAWRWRSRVARPFRKSLLLVLSAAVNFVLFTVAAILATHVTTSATNDVLLRPKNCGFHAVSGNDSNPVGANYTSSRIESLRQVTAARDRGRSCYNLALESENITKVSNNVPCGDMPIASIPYKRNHSAGCPVDDSMCLLKGPAAGIAFETDLIDSSRALGMSAKAPDVVHFRRLTTCAPLNISNYQTSYVPDWVNNTLISVNIGKSVTQETRCSGIDMECTYVYDTHAHEQLYYAKSKFNQWDPIAPLLRDDADLSLFILAANSITYSQPVDDPLFSAHLPLEHGGYIADFNLTSMICSDQYRYCNPENNLCAPYGGLQSFYDITAGYLNMSTRQALTVARFASSGLGYAMVQSTAGLGFMALKAQELVYQANLMSPSLPINQWQIEAEAMFQTALARTQLDSADFARKETVGEYSTIWLPKADNGSMNSIWTAMCNNQKTGSTNGYQNFSILGIAIILIVGTTIILLSYVIDTLIFACYRLIPPLRKYQHKRWQYIADGQLQLQRLAMEGAGYCGWDGLKEDVPTTKGWERKLCVATEHAPGGLGYAKAIIFDQENLRGEGRGGGYTPIMSEEPKHDFDV
ncbi:MAG: hypothetical protein Q9167_002095 [Letrouitia subvulpina]